MLEALTERKLSIALLSAAAVAAAAVLVLFRYVDPNASDSPLPGCIFSAMTHLYCHGCGVTRALHALAHGDVSGGAGHEPLAVAMTVIGPLMLLHPPGGAHPYCSQSCAGCCASILADPAADLLDRTQSSLVAVSCWHGRSLSLPEPARKSHVLAASACSNEFVPNNLVWAILTTLFCGLPLASCPRLCHPGGWPSRRATSPARASRRNKAALLGDPLRRGGYRWVIALWFVCSADWPCGQSVNFDRPAHAVASAVVAFAWLAPG